VPVFVPFFVYCSECGHRNRPHNKPREGMRLALTDQLPVCRKCEEPLSVSKEQLLATRPLAREVQAQLDQG